MGSDFSASPASRLKKIEQSVTDVTGRVATTEKGITDLKGGAQLTKITNDVGGVNLTTTSTTDDILSMIVAAGKGMHTFYAVSGSQNLPITNLSIRGISHFTDATIGWVYATDYRNNVFTNYYDQGAWKGWKQVVAANSVLSGALNTMTNTGDYYVNPDTTGAPVPNAGNLKVSAMDSVYLSQQFTEFATGDVYIRTKYSGSWNPWSRLVRADEPNTVLWMGTALMHVDGNGSPAKATPATKLSACRNGWLLVWSDFDPGIGANDYDFAYSIIPKYMGDGYMNMFAVPNYATSTSDSIIVKKLRVYDDRLEGHADNNSTTTSTSDVVLRYVLEW